MVRWFAATVTSLAIWTAAVEAEALPDHRLTPGTFNPSLSVAAICSIKWGVEPHHADGNAPFHALDQCLFQEG